MTKLSDTAAVLLNHWIFQKDRILERQKVPEDMRPRRDIKRLSAVYREQMEAMASIVDELGVDPGVAMDAVFSLAFKNRHMDGPMPNMLKSRDYILKALSHYMDIPLAAVAMKCTKEYQHRVLQDDFEAHKKMIAAHVEGKELPPDRKARKIAMMVTVPAVYRLLYDPTNLDLVREVGMEALEQLRTDKRLESWAASLGWAFDKAADYVNSVISKHSRSK